MALPNDDRRITRHIQHDYLALNDGYDEDSLPADRISGFPDLETDFSVNFPSSEIQPSESISQTSIESSSPTFPLYPQKRRRLTPASQWMWEYFEITEIGPNNITFR